MAKCLYVPFEAIELFRGKIDFYKYRCSIWYARKWPKYEGSPTSPLFLEFRQVFVCSRHMLSRLNDKVVDAWKKNGFGIRPNWIDQFSLIFLRYYKYYRSLPPVVVDYDVVVQGDYFKIKLKVYKEYNLNSLGGKIEEIATENMKISERVNSKNQITYSMFTDEGIRCPCPWIIYQF